MDFLIFQENGRCNSTKLPSIEADKISFSSKLSRGSLFVRQDLVWKNDQVLAKTQKYGYPDVNMAHKELSRTWVFILWQNLTLTCTTLRSRSSMQFLRSTQWIATTKYTRIEKQIFPAMLDLRASDTQPSNESVVTLVRSHSFRFSGFILLRRWQVPELALSAPKLDGCHLSISYEHGSGFGQSPISLIFQRAGVFSQISNSWPGRGWNLILPTLSYQVFPG